MSVGFVYHPREDIDNRIETTLIGNISKLKKITNFKINDPIKKLIF